MSDESHEAAERRSGEDDRRRLGERRQGGGDRRQGSEKIDPSAEDIEGPQEFPVQKTEVPSEKASSKRVDVTDELKDRSETVIEALRRLRTK